MTVLSDTGNYLFVPEASLRVGEAVFNYAERKPSCDSPTLRAEYKVIFTHVCSVSVKGF